MRRVALKALNSGNYSAINGAISPDGTQVALVSHPCRRPATFRPQPADLTAPQPFVDTGCERSTRVHIAKLDGSATYQVTTSAFKVRHTNPAWSPDGKYLAFIAEGPQSGLWNSSLFITKNPPGLDTMFEKARPEGILDFTAVAWRGSGLAVGGIFDLVFPTLLFSPAPWSALVKSSQSKSAANELVPAPRVCQRFGGACTTGRAKIRPQPADLWTPLSAYPDPDGGLVSSYESLSETCSFCTYSLNIRGGRLDSGRLLNGSAPGVPAAFSPEGDELMLSDGTAIDPTEGNPTRRLASATQIRRVIGWTACGAFCKVTPTTAFAPITKPVTVAPGATVAVELRNPSGTPLVFSAPQIVSEFKGFSLTKSSLRAAAKDCAGATIAPGASCRIMVKFDGKTPGKVSATVFPNAASDPLASFTVTATGKGPTPKVRKLRVSPAKLKRGTKKLIVTYSLTEPGRVTLSLIKSDAKPFATMTTKRSAKSGKLTLRVNRALEAGAYTLQANVFTARYRAPVRSLKLTVTP